MRNYKKLLVLVLVVLFGFATNVKAVSKWDVKREELKETTTGIKPTLIKEENTVVYTIPEDYNGKNIYINISEDVANITAGKYVPGDGKAFTVKIVNNSKYTYNYVKNSFKVITDNMVKLGDKDSYYSYDTNGNVTGIYIKDSISFDNQQIGAYWSIKRTLNDALKKLYSLENSSNVKREKIGNTWKYVYYFEDGTNCNFYQSWSANVCDRMLTDEVLGKELKDQGYENGILDLNKYYLDYYNKMFGTDAKKLEDLPDKAIYGYSDRLNEYLGGILNGNRYKFQETNSEVSELGYNWFYNKGIGLYPVKDVAGNEYNYKNTKDKGFYVGDYMRNASYITEEVVNNDLGTILSGAENGLTPIMMLIDFDYVVNAHQGMDFGLNIKFELEKEVKNGKLVVNYVDLDGNKLTESIITEKEVDTEYATEQKEFDGYEFVKVEGNTTGKYIDGTVEVTYVYSNAYGDVDNKEEAPVVKEEIVTPPHTDATVSANNIVMYLKREEN